MARYRHSTRLIVAFLVVALLTAGAAAACSARAGIEAAASGDGGADAAGAQGAGAAAGDTGAARAKAPAGADMTRIRTALGYMRAVKPSKPIVVLLGGSAARESTISDASWRAQIKAEGGPATLAWNMGSRNRSMAENVALVKHLPEGAQVVVFIGINLGSFTSAAKSASIPLPSPLPTAPPSLQQPHQYSVKTGVLSKAKKKTLPGKWLKDRYPVYKRNYQGSAQVLEKLIRLCQTRGYKPVLFELPRNVPVVGSSLKAPTEKYRRTCKTLAAKYDVPWVSLVARAKLPNSSFYDLWHLVEPGRKVWQKLLSTKAAALLRQYETDGGP